MSEEKKIHGYFSGAPTPYGTPMFAVTDEVIQWHAKQALERLERRIALKCFGLSGNSTCSYFGSAGNHPISVMWSI